MIVRRQRAGCLVLSAAVACGGCNSISPPADDGTAVTQRMREACPMLTDEVLDGFVLAVSGLRDNGLSEEDALQQWVDACDNIPPDGNFQGDTDACKACLPVIIDEVYADETALLRQ